MIYLSPYFWIWHGRFLEAVLDKFLMYSRYKYCHKELETTTLTQISHWNPHTQKYKCEKIKLIQVLINNPFFKAHHVANCTTQTKEISQYHDFITDTDKDASTRRIHK